MRRWGGAFMLVVWMLGTAAGPGQLTDRSGGLNEDLPEPPPSHVLDVAGVFDRYPEELAEVSGRLKLLEKEHGVPVYLVVHGGLLRGGVADHSKLLFDTWIGEGQDGLVLMYEADSRELEAGMPLANFRRMENGDVMISRLPEEDIMPILLELQDILADGEDQVASLVGMTAHLTTRLGGMLGQERSSGPDAGAWKIAWITLLVVGVLTMAGWMLSRVMRGADMKAREQFYFPDVLVGVRLGAQCGGGRVAVRRYGERQERGE